MICDNCLNWYSCKKENHEDRPIQEFDYGDVWCGRRITYQQVKAKWNLEYLLQKQKLIREFLDKIRHIPLFWVIDNDVLKEVYEAIDEIRDYYQKVIKE